MERLLMEIMEALVEEPDQVKIKEVKGSLRTIFEMKVAKADMGRVLGKYGRVADAIRDILSAAGGKEGAGRRYELEIIE